MIKNQIKKIKFVKNYLNKILIKSINSAAREQNLFSLRKQLEKIVPDIKQQYSTFDIDNEFLKTKVRSQHAFQIRLAFRAIQNTNQIREISIMDVGDSSGTHLKYLSDIIKVKYSEFEKVNLLSVNIDPLAVKKIRSIGINAIECKAEDLIKKHNIKANIILSYETLEHLNDPITFLNSISSNGISDYIVLTVPYRKRSRVGLHHIRNKKKSDVYPENTHIFELSPKDWKLIFAHSGWRVTYEEIYRQYPANSFYRLTKAYWKRMDFEGFYGVVLNRDRSWAECYRLK